MTYETTEQEAGELTALAAIKRHYPIIAGRAMQLQQAGEDKAALAWAAVAGDFYTVLAAAKAPQLSGVISSSQIEDFFNIWHRGGPGVNGSVFEWVARRVNETLSTKEPNTLPVPELAAKRIHDAIECGYSKWEAANCSDPSCGCVAVFIEREVLPLLAENALGAGELTALVKEWRRLSRLTAIGDRTMATYQTLGACADDLEAALAAKAPQGVPLKCACCGKDVSGPEFARHRTVYCITCDCDLVREAAAPKPAPVDKRPELEQEYGQDHPWPEFDNWHKEFHEIASGGGIAWPCVKPLRCFWRWTRKSGATVNQNGIVVERATPAPGAEMAALRDVLERCLAFMESIKLVDSKERDAHGVAWPSSRWTFDIREKAEVVIAVREALAAAPPASRDFWNTWFCPEHKPALAHPTGTCFVCNALNNAMGVRCGMCGDTGLQNGKPCPQFGCKVGAFVASGGGVERPHGLVNELEREIIRLNKINADWIREFNMYRNAWQREIGGYIRTKAHEIDGFVLRTQDALKEAEERGRQDSAECVRELEETVNDLLNNLTCSCSATLNQCPRCKLAVEDAKEALTRVPPRTK